MPIPLRPYIIPLRICNRSTCVAGTYRTVDQCHIFAFFSHLFGGVGDLIAVEVRPVAETVFFVFMDVVFGVAVDGEVPAKLAEGEVCLDWWDAVDGEAFLTSLCDFCQHNSM